MIDKGDWERHANSVAEEQGIFFDCPPSQMTVGIGIAKDEIKGNKVEKDRKQVAEFIRSLSDDRTEGQAASNEKMFGKMADLMDQGTVAKSASEDYE